MEYKMHFETHGYAILENVFLPEELATFSNELDRVLSTTASLDAHEKEGQICQDANGKVFLIGDLTRFSPFWAELENFKPMIELAGDLLDCGAYELESIQALIKRSQPERQIHWRRHFPNDAIPRESSQSVCLVLCLDPQTDENGGLRVIKNSHLVSDEGAVVEKLSGENLWRREDEQILRCPAGSVIMVHSKAICGGYTNQTAGSQRLITFSWANSANRIVGKSVPYSVQYEKKTFGLT